ncbi:hypothetical protein LAV84_27885 [Rhizobium sp. VS19-DR104.2]|nr:MULTISPECIES: hypothetical protein [unclassified Rhizobium]MBZ5763330.1 hypothetical protein [Rhizobium sp. VS19-DR96]MBZ5769225.1 hypothetical protein [Rhizobium sp. VS19-DR129.2]MBZ5776780.1 hypothetical protein [Rhizobium sp. VS19-DRK62.2]MBZ5788200.1 hypothetical protein [Rhizobium sp. VS19-DR121]MBZ5805283.1 hypothetical protein [Rhizobium sp. VS19-DR181]
MGTVVKFASRRRPSAAPLPAPMPATESRPHGAHVVARLARHVGRTTSGLAAGAGLAILALLRRPVRWAAQLAIIAFIGSAAVALFSQWREPKIILGLAAITLALILIHATIQGLTDALSRFHHH